jgi:hypothetical protein
VLLPAGWAALFAAAAPSLPRMARCCCLSARPSERPAARARSAAAVAETKQAEVFNTSHVFWLPPLRTGLPGGGGAAAESASLGRPESAKGAGSQGWWCTHRPIIAVYNLCIVTARIAACCPSSWPKA